MWSLLIVVLCLLFIGGVLQRWQGTVARVRFLGSNLLRASGSGVTTLTVARVFGSGMVLQRSPAQPRIWGDATPGVRVQVRFHGDVQNVTADLQGHWVATLSAVPAGGPWILEVRANEATVMLEDVLVGDVYICSGQSNMQFNVNMGFNMPEEVARADQYANRNIRIFQVTGWGQQCGAMTPTRELAAITIPWSHVSSPVIGGFSAVCWFSGRDVLDSLNASGASVPIGLIETDVGSTGVEYWSPAYSIRECNQITPCTIGPSHGSDSTLWNGQVAPFTIGPMAISGILWYQGESNTNPQPPHRPCGSRYYTCQFRSMIRAWRTAFSPSATYVDLAPQLPFVFVLLAPDQKANAVADIRNAQLSALDLPKTYVVNAMDVGDCTANYCSLDSVHVRNKQLIGSRVSQVLLGVNYGSSLPFNAPVATTATCAPSAPPAAPILVRCLVKFDTTTVGSGLHLVANATQATCNPYLPGGMTSQLCKGFQRLGLDGVWTPIDLEHVTVASSDTLEIVADAPVVTLAYAQSDWPLATLYTNEGLPALPFLLNATPAAGKRELLRFAAWGL